MARAASGLLLLCALVGLIAGSKEADVDSDCFNRRDASTSTCHLELVQTKAQALSSTQGRWPHTDPANETATCMVWGPSHVHVFDEKEVTWSDYLLSFFRTPPLESDLDVTEVGDFWLINSPTVKIQGRYALAKDSSSNKPSPFLRAVTIGGKFLEDNTITVGTLPNVVHNLGTASDKVLWNQEEILADVPSSFSIDNLVTAKLVKGMYSLKAPHVQEASKVSLGVTMELPLGINLVVNRGNRSLGLAITMKKIPESMGGQDGQCGNFNGDNEDDTAELINGRTTLKVRNTEQLFNFDPIKSIKDSLKKIHNTSEETDNVGKDAASIWLEAKAHEAGVTTLPSGLMYKVLEQGPEGGPSPGPSTSCDVTYAGQLTDGTEFDAGTTSFAPNQVIAGWTEAMQMMKEGDKWELYIPPNLAYGESGSPSGRIPPGAALVFQMKINKVKGARASL